MPEGETHSGAELRPITCGRRCAPHRRLPAEVQARTLAARHFFTLITLISSDCKIMAYLQCEAWTSPESTRSRRKWKRSPARESASRSPRNGRVDVSSFYKNGVYCVCSSVMRPFSVSLLLSNTVDVLTLWPLVPERGSPQEQVRRRLGDSPAPPSPCPPSTEAPAGPTFCLLVCFFILKIKSIYLIRLF